MNEFLPIIRQASIFSGIHVDALAPMLRCLDAKSVGFAKGETILHEGDTVESVGLLLTGGALAVQEDYWGNRNLIAHIAPGQLFAEAFACSPGAALSLSVVADVPSRILFLNVGRVLTLCPAGCAHHSRVIRNLLSDLAAKNLRLSEKLTHMGQRTTRAKLLSYLSAEARRHGAAAFDIPFSRQQLADYLSVDRSALSAELGRMRDEGILAFQKNHFVLIGAHGR